MKKEYEKIPCAYCNQEFTTLIDVETGYPDRCFCCEECEKNYCEIPIKMPFYVPEFVDITIKIDNNETTK